MTQTDYEIVGFLHDARIDLYNAHGRLGVDDTLCRAVDRALTLVETALVDARFYVSVATDEAWVGSDGMYVDYGTVADGDVGGERLSHFVRPLPESVDDFLVALADLAATVPQHGDEVA